MVEQNYEFRKRLAVVHQANRRDPSRDPEADETVIGEGWNIAVSRDASAYMLNLAKDLQDYLLVSMNVSALVRRLSAAELATAAESAERTIVLASQAELPGLGGDLTDLRSYRLVVTAARIVICGRDERGAGQGSYYMENLMNLREAPFLQRQDVIRRPRFSPRMVHSGWGLDEFPNEHLNAIAHAGMDAILLFTKDVHRTPVGFVDFNDVIERAALYGIDVYAYSYYRNVYHPDDVKAAAFYESTYGALFEASPGLKGVILVGESCGFPSKDERTSMKLREPTPSQTLPKYEKLIVPTKEDPYDPKHFTVKPNPGWWPCNDYPQMLTMLRDTIHRHKPEAEVVLWTYNWGYAPEAERLELIRNLPENIILMATFEMFEPVQHEGIINNCVDYTASFAGPGRYFASEGKAAKERGIRLYTMSNTGGLTWDLGVVPYEPVPYQWALRHEALRRASDDWGLSGLMESHHYGWWPSFVSELAKWAYWEPYVSAEQIGRSIAERDYGEAAAPHVLEAWKLWSEAILDYVPTSEDQYGPFRIGPSYPLAFISTPVFPASWYAMNGSRIFRTMYQPANNNRVSPGAIRIPVEIARLSRMAERWEEGVRRMEQALVLIPERKQTAGRELHGLGKFFLCAVRTTIHVKQWWRLKSRLFAEESPTAALPLVAEMERLALAEIANAEEAIPLVESNSRLGWEPSMEYVGDAKHIRWKVNQVQAMMRGELATYRNSINQLTELPS
jgi:hypothetical protein